MEDEPLTEGLLDELMSAPNIQRYLDAHRLGTPSLSGYLNEQLEERGLKRSEVLRDAGIEQTFGWYVFNGQRGMSRDNVLRLCFTMGFDVRCANRALQAAGANTLYPKNRFTWRQELPAGIGIIALYSLVVYLTTHFLAA